MTAHHPPQQQEKPGEALAVPTAHDREKSRIRQEIAKRQMQEYTRVFAWTLGAFGLGWLPVCRHFLVDRDEEARVHYTDERPKVAATVYTARHEATRETRHFTVEEDGTVKRCKDVEAGFGDMVWEPHPTRGFENRGMWCSVHRYSLCWAPFELYSPKSAEELAAREEKKFIEENPLLAWAGLTGKDDDDAQS